MSSLCLSMWSLVFSLCQQVIYRCYSLSNPPNKIKHMNCAAQCSDQELSTALQSQLLLLQTLSSAALKDGSNQDKSSHRKSKTSFLLLRNKLREMNCSIHYDFSCETAVQTCEVAKISHKYVNYGSIHFLQNKKQHVKINNIYETLPGSTKTLN